MVALTGKVPSTYAKYSGNDVELNLSSNGGLLVQQTGSPGDYFTLMGRRYVASAGTHAGVAPVTAVPTTAAAWVLYNPIGSGRIAVIDGIGSWSVSGTLGIGLGMLVAVSKESQISGTIPTDVALSIKSNLLSSGPATAMVYGVNMTFVVSTPAWELIASKSQLGEVAVCAGLVSPAEFAGTRALTPGHAMGITHLSPAGTTPLFGVSVRWHEVDA